jgi:hypothetical protein
MTEEQVLLDPTSENSPLQRPRIPRPRSLDGLTIGLLDIAKRQGDVFLDRIEERFTARGNAVKRFRKPRFSILAPAGLKQEIKASCDIVVEGLAD